MRMMQDGDALFRILWAIAEKRADDYPFSPRSAELLREFIRTGVDEMEQLGLLNDQAKIEEAKINLGKFVGQMVARARADKARQLQETSFSSAKGLLCPLWPFC